MQEVVVVCVVVWLSSGYVQVIEFVCNVGLMLRSIDRMGFGCWMIGLWVGRDRCCLYMCCSTRVLYMLYTVRWCNGWWNCSKTVG